MSTAAVDLRGFNYPLAALLRKQEWELESLQKKMGDIRQALQQAEVQLEIARDALLEQGNALSLSAGKTLDPAMYQRTIAFLTGSQSAIANQQLQVDKLREDLEVARQACVAQQISIQMLEEHRAQVLDAYVREEQTRQANETDRDWSARSLWRQDLAQQDIAKEAL
ncbi:flagellar export protein FliJ [Herbaspirillum autotrophicum]|uniref:flagellar export protein FliJ n=1 Tax=Herbaspirillum autotrophicum TaxID=180195 RepID=UPI00067A753B|nr:flagellar FliJ family protein [Herbaspirillum autotrophicum]